MTDIKLGTLADDTAQRDAIHIAVVPLVAAVTLYPGQPFCLAEDGSGQAVFTPGALGLGLVDPFLAVPVYPGQRFYGLLYQNTVTGMRHHWAHPAFDTAPVPAPVSPPTVIANTDHIEKSRQKIIYFAALLDMAESDLMEAARRRIEQDEHTIQHGDESWRDAFWTIRKDFWHHYEIVTGKKVDDPDLSIFCCSC